MSFGSSFNLFSPSIPNYHVSSSISGYLTENEQIVSTIIKTVDKRNKIQFTYSEKIKQLATSIPKHMLPNQKQPSPKLQDQQKSKAQIVDTAIKDCKDQRCLFKALFHQINSSLKLTLSALQSSYLREAKAVLKVSDKMHKKLEQKTSLALNQASIQLKKIMQELIGKQKLYEAYKKSSLQAYHKYCKKWKQTQKKQTDCIILISSNSPSTNKPRTRLQDQLKKQCQQCYALQQQYIQQMHKSKQSSASLLQFYEKLIPQLKKLQHHRYQTVKQVLLDRQKFYGQTCGLLIKQSQQILSRIDVIEVNDKDIFPNYYMKKQIAKKQKKQKQGMNLQQQKYFSNSYITVLYDSIIKQRTKQLIAFGWSAKTRKYKKIVDNFLEAKSNGKISQNLVENKQQREIQLIAQNFQMIFRNAIKTKPCKKEFQGVQVEAKQKEQEVKTNNQSRQSQQQSVNIQSKQLQSKKLQQKQLIVQVQQKGVDVHQECLSLFKQQMRVSSQQRKIFIFCLQKFRLDGKFQLQKEQGNVIKKALQIVLNQCSAQLEVINSKKLLVLSFSYFFLQNQQKRYIQQLIKDHAIWSDLQWWQAAFLSSIYQQNYIEDLLRQEKSQQIKSDLQARMVIERSSSQMIANVKNSQNKQFVLQNLIFSNLAAFINNMAMFDISQQQTAKLVNKYASYISNQNKRALQEMLKCQYKDRMLQKIK